MGNEAKKAKKNTLLIKLKYTAICKVGRSQGKIIRKEILNHFKQICKRKKSIDQLKTKKMKRETHQFAKGRKNNGRNRYNHTNR